MFWGRNQEFFRFSVLVKTVIFLLLDLRDNSLGDLKKDNLALAMASIKGKLSDLFLGNNVLAKLNREELAKTFANIPLSVTH